MYKSSTIRVIRSSYPKRSSTAAFTSIVLGIAIGWYYKDSKILTFIISAFTGD
jgi:hypothetical protein